MKCAGIQLELYTSRQLGVCALKGAALRNYGWLRLSFGRAGRGPGVEWKCSSDTALHNHCLCRALQGNDTSLESTELLKTSFWGGSNTPDASKLWATRYGLYLVRLLSFLVGLSLHQIVHGNVIIFFKVVLRKKSRYLIFYIWIIKYYIHFSSKII